MVFNGQKIGFTRIEVRAAADAPQRYEIASEAAMRLRFLGVDKRVNLRAFDRVRPDLTLERFRYRYELDGSLLEIEGHADARAVEFAVSASGARETRRIALDQPLYPSSAIALLPALRGLALGREYRYAVFQGETQTLAAVEQVVLGWETSSLFAGPAFKLHARVDDLESTTWMSPDGRPLLELSLNGVLVSALEDAARAQRDLVVASLNKQDALVDFSLLRTPPIEDARRVSRFEIVLRDVPPRLEVPSDDGQRCSRAQREVRCTIDRARGGSVLDDVQRARYLRPSLAVNSLDGEIVALARTLAYAVDGAQARLDAIVRWMDENVAKEAVDAFTAVEVLRARRAECQGHAYLLAALARAMGLPARVVNGIVYSPEHAGFLYHSWNEVWLPEAGWRAVDATLGQRHADATHVKLIEGERPGELLPLVGMVGRTRIASAVVLARW
ncbi:MAG: transglutaminase-like domain-containing protein [Burkholderiales bacterium]|nr:transglutaminase-like domain-containing protein [Burkholderiales bacterium]